jgi:hypothetical protein
LKQIDTRNTVIRTDQAVRSIKNMEIYSRMQYCMKVASRIIMLIIVNMIEHHLVHLISRLAEIMEIVVESILIECSNVMKILDRDRHKGNKIGIAIHPSQSK